MFTHIIIAVCFMYCCDNVAARCPAKCDCNDTSLLVDCNRAALQHFPITLHPRLFHLKLSNNRIRTINIGSTMSYKRLVTLNLCDNQIASLAVNTFAENLQLQELYLCNNRIQRLDVGLFKNLRLLRVLVLNGNYLRHFDLAATVRQLSNIHTLLLSHNRLQSLSKKSMFTDTVAYLNQRSLQELDLSHNKFSSFDIVWFVWLTRLKRISIASNLLSRLNIVQIDSPKSSLNHLDLSRNRFSAFDKRIFNCLIELKYLFLVGVGLKYIAHDLFAPLVNLEELVLDDNLLESVNDKSFAGLVALKRLSMRNCPKLRQISTNAFSHLAHINYILIENNSKLVHIWPGTFSFPVNSTTYVSLSGNSLRYLPEDVTDDWSHTVFELGGNNWCCDCTLYWMVEKSRAGLNRSDIVCHTPSLLRGQRIDDNMLAHCASLQQVDYVTIAAGVLMFLLVSALVLALVVYKYHYRLCLPIAAKLSADVETKMDVEVDGAYKDVVDVDYVYPLHYYYEQFYSPSPRFLRLVPVTKL